MNVEVNDPSEWDWDEIERDVITKIRALRTIATQLSPDGMRQKLVEDLILPAMCLLGEFSNCVEIGPEGK